MQPQIIDMGIRRKPIAEQVIVVLGASSGIGRLTALELAGRGARVVVAARSHEALESLVVEIRQAGGKALAVPADTAVWDEVHNVAATAERELGGFDTWVHVAGVSVYAPLDKTTPEELNRVISVDLIGQGYGVLAAIPVMKQRGGGHFIAISSVEAELPMPLSASYAAAKHGIGALLAGLRMELEHDGIPIAVTNIMPSSIDTPFFDHARTRLGVKPRPFPPAYDPQRVADAIVSAIERPRRAMVVGGAGRVMVSLHRHAPRLAEALVRRAAFHGQSSREPKRAHDANNLDRASEDTRIRGREAGRANARLQRSRRWRRIAAASISGLAVAAIGWRVARALGPRA